MNRIETNPLKRKGIHKFLIESKLSIRLEYSSDNDSIKWQYETGTTSHIITGFMK